MGNSITYDECLIYIDKLNGKKFNIFVETGTYLGNTVNNVKTHFNETHSIELSDKYHDNAVRRFNNDSKVTIHHGDSSKILPNLINTLTDNTVFFLDGHWSSGDTGKGEKDCPLIEEVTSINDDFKYSAIIIIDDYGLFGTKMNEDWSDITKENILSIVKDRMTEYEINNDRLIIYLNSKN